MKVEQFEKYIFKKYPHLFGQRNLPMSTSCMCWGLETPEGWNKLIEDTCKKMEALKKLGVWVEFIQVKSKFASLRMYNSAFGVRFMFLFKIWRALKIQLDSFTYGLVASKSRMAKNEKRKSLWTVLWKVLFFLEHKVLSTVSRIFTYQLDESIYEIVRDIEHAVSAQSTGTCEECGEYSHLYRQGWWVTLCDKHAMRHFNVDKAQLDAMKYGKDVDSE